jgi:hypothetical protein
MATIFGGDTGLSYEDVQRKRKIADALLAQNMRGSQNVPQGLTSVARALAARSIENKTGQAMEGLNAEADAIFNSIFGGGGGTFAGMGASGGGYTARNAPVGDLRTESQGIADDAMSAIGKEPRGWNYEVPQEFVNSLVGMESGGNFGAVGPDTRHGNALGFGQVMPANVTAWSKEILGREVTPEEFLQNEELQKQIVYAKLDEYWRQTGGSARDVASLWHSGVPYDQAVAQGRADVNMSTKNYADSVAGGFGGGSAGGGSVGGGATPSVQAIAAAMANPVIQNDPGKMAILQSLLGQSMQANDPMRAMEMERAQLELEALRNPQPETTDPTDDMIEYQFALSQGYSGTFQDFMTEMRKAGATNVTTTVGGETSNIGTIPQGYAAIPDPNEPSGYRMVAIPGGPEDTSATEARREGSRTTESEIVVAAGQRAREAYNSRSVGGVLGRVAAFNPASQNAELYRQVDVLRAQAQLGNLTAMREASPTGGALGSVTEGELKILADKSGALDPMSPNFLRDLDDYERTLLRTIHGPDAGDRIFEQSRPVDEMTFESFAADPSAKAAAERYGVTLEEMWEIKKGLQ